ncbi:hypothetical protein M0Q50_00825 [bacterium]|jgi:hypothetical protein|nr:hypothetical protein [bacterium]
MTPKVVARVRCMDGKISEVVNDHASSLYGMCGEDLVIDEISTAGAVKMITEKGFNRALLKSLQISIEGRGAREIDLYIHYGCKYYATKDSMNEQIADAKAARKIILKKFKRYKLTVNIWWVALLDKKEGLIAIQKIKEE